MSSKTARSLVIPPSARASKTMLAFEIPYCGRAFLMLFIITATGRRFSSSSLSTGRPVSALLYSGFGGSSTIISLSSGGTSVGFLPHEQRRSAATRVRQTREKNLDFIILHLLFLVFN
jgi:hypothetical protein